MSLVLCLSCGCCGTFLSHSELLFPSLKSLSASATLTFFRCNWSLSSLCSSSLLTETFFHASIVYCFIPLNKVSVYSYFFLYCVNVKICTILLTNFRIFSFKNLEIFSSDVTLLASLLEISLSILSTILTGLLNIDKISPASYCLIIILILLSSFNKTSFKSHDSSLLSGSSIFIL